MLSVLFFARLWRRAGILTDVAFVELRYGGRPAALLRGFRALYLGLPVNCLIIGWVNLAMSKILSVTLGWDRLTAVFVGLALTGGYVSLSGLRGVVLTDLVQFALAMTGAIAVAVYALGVPEVGGVAGLTDHLPESTFSFLPTLGSPDTAGGSTLTLSVTAFIAYLGVQWWASWYPGQEPGGGGYLAQRMMSARDERHSVLATLWFTLAHYCVRPWPWILAGLAALVLYPDIADREAGYAMIIRDHLPAGWRGLVLGGFVAAFMSTMSTQLNWGTSYLVHDVYARFLRPAASDAHYVRVARLTTLAVMAASAGVTLYLDTVRQAWELILESGAGIGLVLILRWYWWRVNAWSGIAAMVAPVVGVIWLSLFTTVAFPESLLFLVAWTTVCWLAVTWLPPPPRIQGDPGLLLHAGPPWRSRLGASGGRRGHPAVRADPWPAAGLGRRRGAGLRHAVRCGGADVDGRAGRSAVSRDGPGVRAISLPPIRDTRVGGGQRLIYGCGASVQTRKARREALPHRCQQGLAQVRRGSNPLDAPPTALSLRSESPQSIRQPG